MAGDAPAEFPDGVYEVVGADSLRPQTADGARIVRILNTPHAPMFLLRQDRDIHHEELRAQIGEQHRLVVQLENERSRLQRSQYQLEKQLEALTSSSDQTQKELREQLDRKEHESENSGARLWRMEQDIARVRAHVGEKAWKEALE